MHPRRPPTPAARPALLCTAHLFASAALVVPLACGAAPPPPSVAAAPVAPPVAPAAETEPRDEPVRALPTACASGADAGICLPPAPFVERLCNDSYPSVALAMFRQGTPWTRMYLTRNVQAWNASGGASKADKLVFDEEVLLLTHRAPPPGGMIVSGAGAGGGYDVLRWDGSCASLEAEEVTKRLPPKAKFAKIPWKILDDAIQAALLGDARVAKIDGTRRKECKGVTAGSVPAKCDKAERDLGAAVIDFVKKGGALPEPARLP